jgi:hypothetical protein
MSEREVLELDVLFVGAGPASSRTSLSDINFLQLQQLPKVSE